jgi:glycosyltransferase involved in cell wall biosynthesis
MNGPITTETPLVTVVVVRRGSQAALSGTLRSIETQTLPAVEVVTLSESGKPVDGEPRFRDYFCFVTEGHQLQPTFLEKCVFLLRNQPFFACSSWEEGPDGRRSRYSDTVVARSDYFRVRGKRAGAASISLRSSVLAARPNRSGFHIIPEPLISTPLDAAPVSSADPDRRAEALGKPDRPCVLITLPFLAVGGAEAAASRLAAELAARGFRIFIVTTQPQDARGAGDAARWFQASVAGVYFLPAFLPSKLWPAFFTYLLRRHSVGVIWQIGSTYTYSLLPAIRRMFPSIAVVDLLFNPVRHAADYLRYNYCIDHVVTEHDGMKAWLLEHGETGDNISVIPNGIDLTRYSPESRQRDQGRFRVAFIGRLSEEKGPDVFLEVASRLRAEEQIEFALCGAGPLEARLRERARAKGLDGRLHFAGVVSTEDYLCSCDMVVVCSRLDGRPNIVMESMAAGVPVIASRVGGIPEMIPEGTGILCDPGDTDAFARAIRLLAGDRSLHAWYSSAAREHAVRSFSIAEAGARYAELFERVSARRRLLRSEEASGSPPSLSPPRRHWIALRLMRRLYGILSLGPVKNAVLLRNLRRSGSRQELATAFDPKFYLRTYPAAGKSPLPPLLHYVLIGHLRGWNPSPKFDSQDYLDANPDVARAGLNPLLHYIAFGQTEGRPIAPYIPAGGFESR